MSNIPNEKVQSELLATLTSTLNKLADKAKTAVNKYQPLGVSPKVGQAGEAIGAKAALAVEGAVIAKKSVGFFFKSITKAYKDTREQCQKAAKAYETVLNNVKAPTHAEVKEEPKPEPTVDVEKLKAAVEEHNLLAPKEHNVSSDVVTTDEEAPQE